jgi:hypothetical protein
MSLLSPATWLIALTLLVGAYGSGWVTKGWQVDAAELKANRKAAKEFKDKARQTFRLQESRDADIIRTSDLLADALGRLRNRPIKRLTVTPTSCAGASPAAISAEDGEVALRLAAEADRLRADYAACKAFVEMK